MGGEQPEQALEIFKEMQQHGIVPDVITYNALLRALIGMDCKSSALVGGKNEWALKAVEDKFPNISTYTASLIKGWQEFKDRAAVAATQEQVLAFVEDCQND